MPTILTILTVLTVLTVLTACGSEHSGPKPGAEQAVGDGDPAAGKAASGADPKAAAEAARKAEAARIDADFPLHGAVTTTELRVLSEPQPEATVIGWLRIGARARLADEEKRVAGCKGGFHRLHPYGWVCKGDGMEVRKTPIEVERPSDDGWKEGQIEKAAAKKALVLPPPAGDERLPYSYYYVKEPAVPEYHRLPSRDEQRAAQAKTEHFLKLLQKDEKRAKAYMADGTGGPAGTAIAARYLDRGFYVASNGTEVRAFRRFVRTTQGRYIKQAQLETRKGHDFHGIELTADVTLPLAFTSRTARPLILDPRDDGSIAWKQDEQGEPIARQTHLTGWKGRKNLGGHVMHELETERGPRYLKAWFAAVAEKIARPKEVAADEPWVHVDLGEQVLVLYQGDTPIYTTLVSSGVEDHATPTGLFQIQRKRITDTMADIGPDAGDDRYRIEDVPYTQYFEGSFALHAAFWHTGFGLPRSHGCINLTPDDAHRIFGATWPKIPEGWHGASTVDTKLEGSHVLITP
ncbi:MAG: L,D-transpeptidase [Myxococcales bacterium]|nr:L,D-transpeptidase [Myxococcales bacterium]